MGNKRFDFKQFGLTFGRSALPLTTDATLLGAWATVKAGVRALDVGAGCGVIALMLAQRGAGVVDALEVHGPSVEDARDNVSASPWSDRVVVSHGDFMQFEPVGGGYGLIVSNPPYFVESLHSPDSARAAARHAGELSPATLVGRGAGMLVDEGRLAMVVPASMRGQVVMDCELAGLRPVRMTLVRQRPALMPSRLLLEAVKGESGGCIEDELTLADPEGLPTEAYRLLLADFMLGF